MEPVIRLSNASLDLPTFIDNRHARSDISSSFRLLVTPPKRIFTKVIHHVDLDISRGERVALLGRNGAGKSTLLNMMSGTYPPTSGTVEIRGEVGALLNVGLGFNPEATLVENIILRAAAMGLTLAFARSIVDDVLDFSELRKLSHLRLSTLSAGQRMRLGFAISTQTQPEILLLDEWIGTGDEQFIKKAKTRMIDRVNSAGVVVLASHNVNLLRDVCNRGLLIEDGRVVFDGKISDAIREYSHRNKSGEVTTETQLSAYSGYQSLSQGRFLGLESTDLQRLFENRTNQRYSVSFLSPVEFPEILSRVAVAMSRSGLHMRSATGSTRIESISFEGDGMEVVLSLKSIKNMTCSGKTIHVFHYHITQIET